MKNGLKTPNYKEKIFSNDTVHFRRVREMICSIIDRFSYSKNYDLEHIVKVMKGRDYVNNKNYSLEYTCRNCSSFILNSSYVFEVIKKKHYKDQVRGRQYNSDTVLFFVNNTKKQVYAVQAYFYKNKNIESVKMYPIGTFKFFIKDGKVVTEKIQNYRKIKANEVGRYENFVFFRNNAYKAQYREDKEHDFLDGIKKASNNSVKNKTKKSQQFHKNNSITKNKKIKLVSSTQVETIKDYKRKKGFKLI